MTTTRTIIACLMLLTLCMPARADGPTHEAAIKELFDTMKMKDLIDTSIVRMTDLQVKQNPMVAPYRQIMLDFTTKYMSWDALAPDMIKLYMEQFTEAEVREINAFYNTPTGQKAVKAIPELMAKGAEIGQKRVQEHMPELQQAIREAAAKQGR